MSNGSGREQLERLLSAIARRCETPIARLLAWGPLRESLHRRALRAWRASEEPLIVCLGNINRSPFAAQLARRRGRSRARSAGFYRVPGRPSPQLTVTVAHGFGVDLSAHRSVVLETALEAGATPIFVFDIENLARMLARRPRALRRTHLLGSLAAEGPVVIADPHGRERAVLERVLGEIAGAIERTERTQDSTHA